MSVNEDDIRREFRRYGRIIDVTLKSYYAFIHFESVSAAEEAVADCHRVNVFGQGPVNCEFAEGNGRK